VRALLWPLIASSAWAQPATLLEGTKCEGADLALFAWSAWDQTPTVVEGTTDEGSALDSVRSDCVGSASHCGGWHDRCGRCSGLGSIGLLVLRQPLWWRERQVRALLWPLIAWRAWDQPGTVVVETKGEGALLASNRPFGVGSASHCVAGPRVEGAALGSDLLFSVDSASHCGVGHDCLGH
jgi:hypothetical protein